MASGEQEFCVGRLEEIPVGRFKIVQVGGREIGVTRLPDGEVRALHNACPHKGAPVCRGIVGGTWPPSEPGELQFAKAGEVLVCPWHGYEFDLRSGLELYQEQPSRLLLVPSTVADGQVMVRLRPRRGGGAG